MNAYDESGLPIDPSMVVPFIENPHPLECERDEPKARAMTSTPLEPKHSDYPPLGRLMPMISGRHCAMCGKSIPHGNRHYADGDRPACVLGPEAVQSTTPSDVSWEALKEVSRNQRPAIATPDGHKTISEALAALLGAVGAYPELRSMANIDYAIKQCEDALAIPAAEGSREVWLYPGQPKGTFPTAEHAAESIYAFLTEAAPKYKITVEDRKREIARIIEKYWEELAASAKLEGAKAMRDAAAKCVDAFGGEKQKDNGLDRGVQDLFRARERIRALSAEAVVGESMRNRMQSRE